MTAIMAKEKKITFFGGGAGGGGGYLPNDNTMIITCYCAEHHLSSGWERRKGKNSGLLIFKTILIFLSSSPAIRQTVEGILNLDLVIIHE